MTAHSVRPSSASLLGLMFATGLVGAALLGPQAAFARLASPFANFAGRWVGGGEVTGTNGNRERIHCRANYEISGRGDALNQSLVCASDTYRVQISSYVVANGQSVQGTWQEATRQAQGQLTGQIANGRFEGSVSGAGFTAQVSLRATGNRQVVDIRPQGADVARVEVFLSRER